MKVTKQTGSAQQSLNGSAPTGKRNIHIVSVPGHIDPERRRRAVQVWMDMTYKMVKNNEKR